MRLAIIDLGTNSVRFDIHQLHQTGKVKTLYREKLMVRLGQAVFLTGKLNPDAIDRCVLALSGFAAILKQLQVDKVVAFATSALREASDRDTFVRTVRRKTGIELKIISGEEEARLISKGILKHEKSLPTGTFALVDIGGGSTEVSICSRGKVLRAASFDLGVARLQQVFLKRTPSRTENGGSAHSIELLRHHIQSTLQPVLRKHRWPKVARVVGSSGTARALVRINRAEKKHKKGTLALPDLKKLVKRISTMTTTDLLSLPGLEARRVDLIVPGAILLEEISRALGAREIQNTDFALRDGVLEEERALLRQQRVSHHIFALDEFKRKAKNFRIPESHTECVLETAETLFEKLRPVHKLDWQWKSYLSAAAILHDIGTAVSPSDHELHSYYIIQNSHFARLEEWQVEFIALLCLHHKDWKTLAKDVPYEKEPRKRTAFLKLLALLRVADALDRGHQGSLLIKRVTQKRGVVQIKVQSKTPLHLEMIRLEQKKDLFETVFRKEIVITR